MGAEKTIGSVLFGVGLAAFAALAGASRRVMLLERAVDPGHVVVLAVLAAFSLFCVAMGWHLFRLPPSQAPSAPREEAADAPPSKRVTVSRGCAAAGVVLLILSVLVPAHWHPVVLLFAGLALLSVSHALTPCVERIELLRRARGSERQL